MPSGSHDINVRLLTLMGIVSTILIVALVVATQAWFRYEFQQENRRKYVEQPFPELVELKETQLAALHASPHTAEKTEADPRDRIIVPIDMAMREVIRRHSGQ